MSVSNSPAQASAGFCPGETLAFVPVNMLKRRGAIYHVRAFVPADLHSVVRRVEVGRSMKTEDYRQALDRASLWRGRLVQLWTYLRGNHGLMSREKIAELVELYTRQRYEAIEEAVLDPIVGAGENSWGGCSNRDALEESYCEQLQQAENDVAFNRFDSVTADAHALIAKQGFALPEDLVPLFHRALLDARLKSLKDALGAVQGQPLPIRELAPRVLQASQSGNVSAQKLSELVNDYLVFRATSKPMRPKSREGFIKAVALLIDIMGDKPLRDVRNKDAQDFATKIATMPNRWQQKPEFRGKTAREVSEMTQGKGLTTVKPATVNKDMGLLRPFFKWACKRVELPSNPLDTVDSLPIGNARDKKHPFVDDELLLIASFIYDARVKRPDRYWVATLLAYTGARLEEIAQLRTSDVVNREGITCITILDAAGSVKGGAGSVSERTVPVHSQVLAKGFLIYVATRPQKGRLWFDEKTGRSYGDAISKWFNGKLNGLKLENRHKKSLHSLRHTMIDRLRAAKIDALIRRELVGHSYQDVEDQVYGSADGMSVKVKQEALELVKLPI